MALTISEASDVNHLLGWVLGIRGPGEGDLDDQELADRAENAAARLAYKAYKALGAGLRGDSVHEHWVGVEACPWRDS